MRAFASYLAGVLTLVMILAAGGAWTPTPVPRLVPVELDPERVVSGYRLDIIEREEPSVVRALPPGCEPPRNGATCVTVAVAGGLDVPVDSYDLVPDVITTLDDWRPLVARYFEPRDVDRALRVIRCESRGNPGVKNPTSSASGLFQHLARLWPERSSKAGWAGSDVFDPVANVAVAAWLVYEGGGWSHWYPSRGCWG